MRTLLFVLGIALLPFASSVSGTVPAQSPVEALLDRLAAVTALRGSFVQRQVDAGSGLSLESSGRYSLLRPGYFRWEINSPDRQLIIADPQYVWHYDIDLATATRRPVQGGSSMAPLQLLGGDEGLLRRNFSIAKSADDVFTLTPTDDSFEFSSVEVAFDGAALRSMQIRDRADQTISIEFSDGTSPADLAPEDFAFTPPDGVDVFFHDQ